MARLWIASCYVVPICGCFQRCLRNNCNLGIYAGLNRRWQPKGNQPLFEVPKSFTLPLHRSNLDRRMGVAQLAPMGTIDAIQEALGCHLNRKAGVQNPTTSSPSLGRNRLRPTSLELVLKAPRASAMEVRNGTLREEWSLAGCT